MLNTRVGVSRNNGGGTFGKTEQRRRQMRFGVIGAVLATAAMFAVAGPIAAQAAEFDVGPGGVRVEGHHDRNCRVIIDHHINDRGERVTVRRRECD